MLLQASQLWKMPSMNHIMIVPLLVSAHLKNGCFNEKMILYSPKGKKLGHLSSLLVSKITLGYDVTL